MSTSATGRLYARDYPPPRADVAVVVVDYKSSRTPDEELSLRHLRHFLGGYDRYLVLPRSVEATLGDFRVVRFDDRHFQGREAFSRFAMRPEFYEAFLEYDYVLIHQLDALVFSDQLRQWCARGYDNVGAPWFLWLGDPEAGFAGAGNGGFSLRRVRSFLSVLHSRRHLDEFAAFSADLARVAGEELGRRARRFARTTLRQVPDQAPGQTLGEDAPATFATPNSDERRRPGRRALRSLPRAAGHVAWYLRAGREARRRGDFAAWYTANVPTVEDVFWARDARLFWPPFRSAPPEVALGFSFEYEPAFCLERSAGRLPFGCHAWNLVDREFWKPYLLGPSATDA